MWVLWTAWASPKRRREEIRLPGGPPLSRLRCLLSAGHTVFGGKLGTMEMKVGVETL